jgi:1,2-diacylglycerol 3-beta-galactosyltransferase
VNRCYCPSKEVAKRAALDGLEDSQIRVFGLPIRPSFALAVLSKVHNCDHTFAFTHALLR